MPFTVTETIFRCLGFGLVGLNILLFSIFKGNIVYGLTGTISILVSTYMLFLILSGKSKVHLKDKVLFIPTGFFYKEHIQIHLEEISSIEVTRHSFFILRKDLIISTTNGPISFSTNYLSYRKMITLKEEIQSLLGKSEDLQT